MCNFSAYFSHDDLPKYLITVVYYKTLDFQSYNVSSENGEESSLNISLKEVLAADAVEKIAVIGDEISRVFGS